MESSNPYAPPAANVRDIAPEGTGVELSGRAVRLGAYVLDVLIGGLLAYVPVFFFANPFAIVSPDGHVRMDVLRTVMLASAPGAILSLVILIWLEVKNRQTIGKKLLGIKVVRSNGARVGLARLFWLRNIVIGLTYAIPFAGFFIMLIDHLLIFRESQQCLHDQIADTIVVKA